MKPPKHDFKIYMQEQTRAVFGNSSVVVKFVCVFLVVGYLLSFSAVAMKYLTVTPGYLLPPNFWIWTYLTHSLIETHWWEVVLDIFIVVLYGKLLEPLWGAMEMLIFYLVVNSSVAICSSFCIVFLYLLTKDENYLFRTHIHGFAGYLAGFSVAVKQVMPDNILVNNPIGKLRNKDIPLILLIVAIILRIGGVLDKVYPIMFGFGLLSSWIYLRFYQRHSNGQKGDFEDGFSFASFFPSAIQPFITIPANIVFAFLLKVKICKKPQRRYDVSSPTTIAVSLPGMDPSDAERRRLRAIKALNDRLSKAEQEPDWPNIEDGAPSDTVPTKETSVGEEREATQAASVDAAATKAADEPKTEPDHTANAAQKE